MFKRILCTLLTAVMVLTATPLAFAEGDITFPLVDEPLTLRFMALVLRTTPTATRT